jgi:hypothetical protein
MPGNAKQVLKQVGELGRSPSSLGPTDFESEGSVQATTTGEWSLFMDYIAPTAHRLRTGRENRFRLSIPAYQSFTSDGTDGNTETFTLSHDLFQCPNTDDVVVWIGSTYYGAPDSTDYANDSIDVTDPGSNNDIYVWYMADEVADIEILKKSPAGGSQNQQRVYQTNLNLVHQTDQSEQPEFLELNQTRLHPWVPAEFKLEVQVNAPYTVRYNDENGDGATASNMLFDLPVVQGNGQVDGFGSVVKADMGRE